MKTLIIIALTALLFQPLSAQPHEERTTVVTSTGRVFYKSGKQIVSKQSEDALQSYAGANEGVTEQQRRNTMGKLYLLNTDDQIKSIFKSVFTPELATRYEDDYLSITVAYNNQGRVVYVMFGVKPDQAIHSMNIDLYAQLEDAIKTHMRFNVPDKGIKIYRMSLPFIKTGRLYSDLWLFSPRLYGPTN